MECVMMCIPILILAWAFWPDYPPKPDIHWYLAKEACDEIGIDYP